MTHNLYCLYDKKENERRLSLKAKTSLHIIMQSWNSLLCSVCGEGEKKPQYKDVMKRKAGAAPVTQRLVV